MSVSGVSPDVQSSKSAAHVTKELTISYGAVNTPLSDGRAELGRRLAGCCLSASEGQTPQLYGPLSDRTYPSPKLVLQGLGFA